MRLDWADVTFLAGLLFMAIGAWLWYAPAVWIVVGALLVLGAVSAVLPPRGGVRDD